MQFSFFKSETKSRIVEVGGVNIEILKPSEVIKRIRDEGEEVSLVVVDPKTDGYFRKKAVTVTASRVTTIFFDLDFEDEHILKF